MPDNYFSKRRTKWLILEEILKLIELDDDDLTKKERDEGLEYFIRETIERFNLSDKITLHIGDALEVIDEIDGNFDLIFIDADKANYPTYFEKCVERLSSGGILIADNILWYGKVVLDVVKNSDKETKAIKNFNKMVTEDERLDNLIIPLRDGLMVARKK